jgi:hypothetical protein
MPIGSVIGGFIGKGGADAAAGKAGEAAGNSDYIRHRNEANLSPWFQSGQGAQNLIAGLLGLGSLGPDGQGYGGLRLNEGNWKQDQQNAFSKFQASPDYNFRMQQGQKALDMSAASRGNLLSGKQVQASQQYGGNLASGEYNNWFSKLMGVGSQGQAAAMGENASNLGATQLQQNALLAQGQFQKAGAEALGSGISKGFENLMSLGAYGGGGGKFGIPGWA